MGTTVSHDANNDFMCSPTREKKSFLLRFYGFHHTNNSLVSNATVPYCTDNLQSASYIISRFFDEFLRIFLCCFLFTILTFSLFAWYWTILEISFINRLEIFDEFFHDSFSSSFWNFFSVWSFYSYILLNSTENIFHRHFPKFLINFSMNFSWWFFFTMLTFSLLVWRLILNLEVAVAGTAVNWRRLCLSCIKRPNGLATVCCLTQPAHCSCSTAVQLSPCSCSTAVPLSQCSCHRAAAL